MKQVCSLCSHRCHISKVQCGAGREYFGLKNNRGPMFIHNNDLNSKLMKCGRMLMHKTGRKLILQLTLNGKEYLKTYTKEKDMLDILTKEEKEQLNSILNKIIENIKKEH